MSWIVGLLLNGIICLTLAGLLSLTEKVWLKVILFVCAPYLFAHALYWGLAYLESAGTPSTEYSSWSGIFVGPWAASGYVAMGAGFIVFAIIRANRNVRA
jgi:hypothetical protein